MREEGGTPSIVGAIRAGMAFQLKEAVTCTVISQREQDICKMVFDSWKNIPELKILGNTSVSRLPIFSFVIQHTRSNLYLHHNFVCALLNDLYGIQTRSGCACAGPYALDLLGIDEAMALQFAELLAEDKTLDQTHLHQKVEYSGRKVLSPGFNRLSLSYFMSDSDIHFVLECIAQVAVHGWKLLPVYSFNPETGEYKHNSREVFFGRKWLSSISYKTGSFAVKENNIENVKIKSQLELLEEASSIFSSSSQEVSRKFTPPGQKLIFDAHSSDLRWFLLPSEAEQYITGEEIHIKDPVFVVRSSNFIPQNTNCNFQDNNLSCFTSRESINNTKNIVKDDQKCKLYSLPKIVFNLFIKAVTQFKMFRNSDRILVCISGGNNSLALLHTLLQYQQYCAKKQGTDFEIGAITVYPKSPLYDPSPLKGYMKALNVPYFYEEQDIVRQAAQLEQCTPIHSVCGRLKRDRIYACAHREGYNVIALGQHLDDLAESFLMSVFQNGQLRTMKAHYYTAKLSSIRVVRPFVFVREKDLRTFAEEKLPVIFEKCPACSKAPKERHRVKQLLAAQEMQFPNLYHNIKTAMINLATVEDKLLGNNAI